MRHGGRGTQHAGCGMRPEAARGTRGVPRWLGRRPQASRRRWLLAGVLLLAVALPALAQRRGGRRGDYYDGGWKPNRPYDGQFTFVRIAYNREQYEGAMGPSQYIMWSHDYPTGETHFMKIMNELTTLSPS